MAQQSEDGRAAVLAAMVELVEHRRVYAAGLSGPPLNIPLAKHAEMGRDVIQGRLSQILATPNEQAPQLDIGEAFDAFVVALAHFAVADGRKWAITSIRIATVEASQLELANERNEP